MILALDLGTRTGWASSHDGLRVESGWVDFSNKRYEGGGMRYLRFRRWLQELPVKPVEVHFEEVRRHSGTDAAHVYGGLLAVLTAWCEEQGIPYSGVPVGTIKKSATGKGNASKGDMIAAAQALGCLAKDDNEVDAWWLLRLVLAERILT